MEAEEPVEIEGRLWIFSRRGDGDRGTRRIVITLAEWHDHVQTIHRAALKDRDQDAFAWRSGGRDRPREEFRRESKAHERQSAVFQENAPRDHGVLPFLKLRRAEDECPRLRRRRRLGDG